jgi:hypothetical protein
MPLRKQTQMQASMQKYIAMLYEKPALKFLKCGEPWEDLADVMFGPTTSRPSRDQMEKLKSVWRELRADILEAQQRYAPHGKPPWGSRFD